MIFLFQKGSREPDLVNKKINDMQNELKNSELQHQEEVLKLKGQIYKFEERIKDKSQQVSYFNPLPLIQYL
jgi:hypothetical protein